MLVLMMLHNIRKELERADHRTTVLVSQTGPVCVSMSHQISVDEAALLQVLHALADVLTHGEHLHAAQSSAVLPQEVQQATVLHELRHDADRTLCDTHSVQLDQLGVTEMPARTHTHTHTDTHTLMLVFMVYGDSP